MRLITPSKRKTEAVFIVYVLRCVRTAVWRGNREPPATIIAHTIFLPLPHPPSPAFSSPHSFFCCFALAACSIALLNHKTNENTHSLTQTQRRRREHFLLLRLCLLVCFDGIQTALSLSIFFSSLLLYCLLSSLTHSTHTHTQHTHS